jgi:hypothetical protein
LKPLILVGRAVVVAAVLAQMLSQVVRQDFSPRQQAAASVTTAVTAEGRETTVRAAAAVALARSGKVGPRCRLATEGLGSRLLSRVHLWSMQVVAVAALTTTATCRPVPVETEVVAREAERQTRSTERTVLVAAAAVPDVQVPPASTAATAGRASSSSGTRYEHLRSAG